MTRRRTNIVCKGGLNTSSPDHEILPGQVIHADNIEQGIRGGYRRIDGYERTDGREVPSSVSYYKVTCSALTVAIPAGAKLVIGSSIAMTTQAHSASDVFLYLSSPHVIQANTAVTFSNVTVCTTADPITSRYSTDAADMALWDTAVDKWRDSIHKVPGSGNILGAAMREGEIVAFRNNAQDTESIGYKAIGQFLASERQTLYSDVFEAASKFGTAVSVSTGGKIVVVGSYSEDGSGTDRGAAYVFLNQGGVLVLEQKLTASDTADTDYFGASVSVSADGDTIAVGAYLEDGSGTDRGAVYVFTRSGTAWTQEQKIVADPAEDSSYFGYSVSLSSNGDDLAIGAYLENGSGTNRGAVYVFTRASAVWTQEQKLTASDAADGDYFGFSVSISANGDTAAIGAYQRSVGGAVYTFARVASVWSEEQILTASDTETDDWFGYSVSIAADGASVIVGAHQEEG